jgi:hypothetical protein
VTPDVTWPGIVTGAVAALGVAYLARRGQNLADKNDITRLTRLVEEVRSEIRISEEHARSLFAKDTATHVKRFEVELPIYQDLWNKVVDLDDALGHVRVAAVVGSTTDRRTPSDAYAEFRARLTALQDTVKRLEPFFAPEVSKAILSATLPLRLIAAQAPVVPLPTEKAERDAALEAQSKVIVEALAGLRESIRARLLADAIAASTTPIRAEPQSARIVVRDAARPSAEADERT